MSQAATDDANATAFEPWVITILRSLRQIQRRIELGSSELEAAHGVTQPQLICLRAIAAAPGITQVELASDVSLSASTLVGVIDRLEHKGLVGRTRDTSDRRRILLDVTSSGAEKIRSAPEPFHQRVQRALAGLNPDELAAMATTLERLVDLADARSMDASPILASGPIPKPPDLESAAHAGAAPRRGHEP